MGDDDSDWPERDLRSYGRRRGRKLSPRQTSLVTGLLPRLRLALEEPGPMSLGALFAPAAVHAVWLEIGFGGGEHLVWQALHNPGIGLIGCEPFEEGVVKVLTAVDEQSIENIRLWPDDARSVLRWLPEASIERIFVLFPDPWPKKRHQKRRLLSPATLALIANALRPGGELRIGTDIDDYARTILMAVQATPSLRWTAQSAHDWRVRPEDWPPTRYEEKALREGRRCVYLRFSRARPEASVGMATD